MKFGLQIGFADWQRLRDVFAYRSDDVLGRLGEEVLPRV